MGVIPFLHPDLIEGARGTTMANNSVEFGWGAPPMSEQHPVLGAETAENFDKDNMAITRLSLRDLITDAQKRDAFQRLTKKIEKAIRAALQKQDT